MTQLIYGQNPVAEAHRGRRSMLREWTREDVGDDQLERLCGSPEHQGRVAEVEDYPYADADSLLRDPQALVLALDGVQDPRNLGAICRSAEVAGASGIVIPRHRAAEITPAACKASAGAVEHLAVARVRNLADWLLRAKRAGAWVYGTEAGAADRYDRFDSNGRLVFVLGGEGKGLGRRVAAACDAVVSIPQRGRIESLNVSAAAAVILFEALRQRG